MRMGIGMGLGMGRAMGMGMGPPDGAGGSPAHRPASTKGTPPPGRPDVGIGRMLVLGLLLGLGLAAACSDASEAIGPGPSDTAFVLTAVSLDTVTVKSGRRSPRAFAVRATRSDGSPAAGVRVRFALSDPQLGFLSQEVAIADSAGVAESWLLDARPGRGAVVAEGGTSGPIELPVLVERAPGLLEFAPGSGAVGLHGLPHPDSILRLRVLDTEGDPMPGRQVYFSAGGQLSQFIDTTDVDGWAETRLRTTRLGAGPGYAFAFLADYPELLARTERPTRGPAQRMVLVSVDGLRADAINAPGLTTFADLASRGASGVHRSIGPSLTVPTHLSMLSGVGPAGHGVFSEVLEFTPAMNALEPAFRISVREGGDTRAFMAAAGPLAGFEEILQCRLAFGFERLTTVTGGAGAIVDAALEAVSDTALSGVFLHLPDPDRVGHESGFTGPAYAAAVRDVDVALGRLVTALPEGTLLMVTSDHGGGGSYGSFQHGSDADADMLVPLLLLGPGVQAGSSFPSGGSLLDVAPTLVWSLGKAPPGEYEGRPRLEVFRNP